MMRLITCTENGVNGSTKACVRLLDNTTLLHEIRLRWKSLELLCEPETTLFTRDSIYNVIDSKRCPHVGSCKGDKCGIINSSTLIPELEQGNRYPGNTACVESCGGPGCDCFFISSGCLFYRIYMVPIDEKVYEIFHCNRWREAANIEITHFDGIKRETSSTITEKLIPNIPKKWKSLTFTPTSRHSPISKRFKHSLYIRLHSDITMEGQHLATPAMLHK
ncbi:hypothetical protein COOONC_09325 [Cooperia oncophora]